MESTEIALTIGLGIVSSIIASYIFLFLNKPKYKDARKKSLILLLLLA